MVSDDLAVQIARARALAAGARERLERVALAVDELKRIVGTGEGANGTRGARPAQAEVEAG